MLHTLTSSSWSMRILLLILITSLIPQVLDGRMNVQLTLHTHKLTLQVLDGHKHYDGKTRLSAITPKDNLLPRFPRTSWKVLVRFGLELELPSVFLFGSSLSLSLSRARFRFFFDLWRPAGDDDEEGQGGRQGYLQRARTRVLTPTRVYIPPSLEGYGFGLEHARLRSHRITERWWFRATPIAIDGRLRA